MSKDNLPNPLTEKLLPTSSEDVQTALAALQLRKLQKEVLQQEEAEQTQKNARAQSVENARKSDAKKAADQELCTHVKPNGRSALAGQKTHSQERGYHYTFICQYCQKDFNETNIPPNLKLSAEQVGGPTN